MEDKISIKYFVGNSERIKLFGKKFVENNKGLCRLRIKLLYNDYFPYRIIKKK